MDALLERQEELDALHVALHEAAAGRGSVAVVTGEPGIGKTALASRFAGEAATRARVRWGICDDLGTPRPLGALRDVAARLDGPLAAALDAGEAPEAVHRLLLDELAGHHEPTIVILEDVHWADRATIDAIVTVGRRLGSLPVLLVLTLRGGEVDPGHPLYAAIDALQATTSAHLELAPLSSEAVAELAGAESPEIHAVTGGNPFFVTEVLAHGHTAPSTSLANVVLGRLGRLPEPTRAILELVAVVPSRVGVAVLDHAAPGWEADLEAAERHGLVRTDAEHVRFRHELSRQAARASLPPGRRRALHRRVLDALLALDADPAEVVHHAHEAGEPGLVAAHAPAAARAAAAVAANREALAHYRRALDLAEHLDAAEHTRLCEEAAHTAYLVGDLDAAVAAIDAALDLADRRGEDVDAGRCRSLRARLRMFLGDGEGARRDAAAAAACLEHAGGRSDLATARLQVAELAMLASETTAAVRASEAAIAAAGDDEAVRIRALVTIGAARLQRDPRDDEGLRGALRTARRAGADYDAVLALTALGYYHLQWVRPDVAREALEQGRALAREREVDGFAGYLDAALAWLHLREGAAGEAAALARASLEDGRAGRTVSGLLAHTVLAELAVRRGDDDAETRLGALADEAGPTGELQRIAPVVELEVERALCDGTAPPLARLAGLGDLVGAEPLAGGYAAARLAAWSTVCGRPMTVAGPAPRPHAALLDGDLRGAADAFGAVGWRHDRALVLSLLDEEEALAEALSVAREVGAAPLERRVARRLRRLGLAVPRGAHASTRANPAGLTDRQLEVLGLLCEGRRNAEIAGRLHISTRTVEHHVSTLLERLGASSRAEAVARWSQLEAPGAATGHLG
ncbi:MAG: ATP-binding protein [Actinomycetota bacterium]